MDDYFDGPQHVSFNVEAAQKSHSESGSTRFASVPDSSHNSQSLFFWMPHLVPCTSDQDSTKQVLRMASANTNEQRPALIRACYTPSISNTQAASSVSGHVWSLSQDPVGCREVQDAFDVAADDEARVYLAMELVGHVHEASQCPHANHVLRKCIRTMLPESLQFIIDEFVKEGAEAIRQTVHHRYGCRIIEALLKNCSNDQMCELVRYFVVDVIALSSHMYGNFIIQRLLEHGSDDQRQAVSLALRASIRDVGSNFYGSVVILAALKYGLAEDRLLLARTLLDVNGLLSMTMRFRHGECIKDQLLELLEPCEHYLVSTQLVVAPLKIPRRPRAGNKV
jgi:hypothetical protein